MKVSSECPSERMLRELISDRLTAEVSDRLTDHVGQCLSCQQRLAGMESLPKLASQLPQLKNKDAGSAQLREAMDRAKAMTDGPQSPPLRAKAEDLAPVDLSAISDDGYELLGSLGQGGMGVVYQARERSLDRVVAVKVLSPWLVSDAPSRERFLREARSAAAVVHPNVITIHAVSDKPPTPYLVMEFIEGVSLQQQLDSGARISLDNVIRIGRQVSAGLSAAHDKGVVHRDVKPGNIMLNARTGKVLLGDFGLARAADGSRLTRTGTLVGTPAYVAPEVLENPESADHRADLFSLGVVMYAMCTGDSPFQADTLLGTLHRLSASDPEPLAGKVEGVPVWLSDIVMRLLEKDPTRRFQTAADVRAALGQGSRIATSSQAHSRGKDTETANAETRSTEYVPVDTGARPRSSQPKLRRKRQSRSVWLGVGVATSMILVASIGYHVLGPGPSIRSASPHASGNSTRSEELPKGHREGAETDQRIVRSLVGDATPFACLNLNGDVVNSYARLEDAIENLDIDGKIEIRSNQQVVSGPCFLPDQSVTIAAGEGYQPILRFMPHAEFDLESMLAVTANLTLEGLEIQMSGHSDDEDCVLIGVEASGSLRMVDCTLIVEGGGFCVYSQSRVSMEGCQLHAPQATVLDLDPQGPGRTELRNSWISGETGLELYSEQRHEIVLTQCTLACAQVFNINCDDEEEPELLTIDSRQSLYFFEGHPLSVHAVDAGDTTPIRRRVRWTGFGNVFSGTFAEGWDDEADDEEERRLELDRWAPGLIATGSVVENALEIDSEELAESIRDGSFRLSDVEKAQSVSAGAVKRITE